MAHNMLRISLSRVSKLVVSTVVSLAHKYYTIATYPCRDREVEIFRDDCIPLLNVQCLILITLLNSF